LPAGLPAVAALGASLLASGCFYRTIDVHWKDGSPKTTYSVVKDRKKRTRELAYSLDTNVGARRETVISATASYRDTTRMWLGRRKVVTRTRTQYAKRENLLPKIGASLLAGALGYALGTVRFESYSDSADGGHGGGILMAGCGVYLGWDGTPSDTRTVPTGRVETEVVSESEVYFERKPDKEDVDSGPASGVTLRFSGGPLLLRGPGGEAASELRVPTDSRGRARVTVESFPRNWAPPRQRVAAQVLADTAGREITGEAEVFVRGQLVRSASERAYEIAVSTEAVAPGGDPAPSVENATRKARIPGYVVEAGTVESAAARFVNLRLNSQIRPVDIDLLNADTRAPVRNARIDVTVRSPTPEELLSKWFAGDLRTRLTRSVASCDRGSRQEVSTEGSARATAYTPEARISLRVAHPDYLPFSEEFDVRPNSLRRTVKLVGKRDLVDRAINSRIMPMTIRLCDIDSRAPIMHAKAEVRVESPGAEELLLKHLPEGLSGEMERHVVQFDCGRRSEKEVSGVVRARVYTPEAVVTLAVSHPRYHPFSVRFKANDRELRKTIYMTEKTQPDRSRMMNEGSKKVRKP